MYQSHTDRSRLEHRGDSGWADALEDFVLHQRASLAPKTALYYEAQMRLVARWMVEQGVALSTFQVRDLDRYLDWRKGQASKREPGKKVSDNTRRKDAICTRVFMRFCFRRGIVDRDVFRDYRLPRGNRTLTTAPSEDAILRFIKALPDYWDPDRNPGMRYVPSARRRAYRVREVAIIAGLAKTGARESELLGLLLADYDPEGLRVTFRDTKTNTDRWVPIDGEWAAMVSAWLKIRPQGGLSPCLFTNEYGDSLTPGAFGWMFRRIRKWMRDVRGLEVDWSPHGLRHYAVTAMCNRAGIDKAMKLAGHKSIATTQMYNHTEDTVMEEAYRSAALLPMSGERPILVNRRSVANRRRKLI